MENVDSPVMRMRLRKKIDQLARQGKLNTNFYTNNTTREKLEWAYRVFSANMILGDYSWYGWETRSEWSWELSNHNWFYPRWNGKPCKLLVLAEQGIGDEILFASCFKDLQRVNPDLTIECDSRILKTFERSFPGIKFVSRWHDGLVGTSKELTERRGEFDAFIPAGNVPKLYRRSKKDFPRVPYLTPPEKKIDLPKDAVGVVHIAGGYGEKEVAFETLAEGTPVNLNHKVKVEGALNLYPDDFEDFIAMAAQISKVNCVPSTLAHLCGALGTPCNIVKPPKSIKNEANTILKYAYPRESGPMVWYGAHVKFWTLNDFNRVR